MAKASAKKKEAKKDLSKTYNEFKTFEGHQYTGMKIGRSHKWNYDQGVWKETKITPDLWEISYAVTKRRAGKAPEGSGVPVGTEYHWYILAHQNVRKLDANSYTTSLTGLKYKLAHKRADKEKWSASAKAQRNRLIRVLQDLIAQLEKEPPEESMQEETVEVNKDAASKDVATKQAASKPKAPAKKAAKTATSKTPAKSKAPAVSKAASKPASKSAARASGAAKPARRTRSKQRELEMA
jgi:hypothetical protein